MKGYGNENEKNYIEQQGKRWALSAMIGTREPYLYWCGIIPHKKVMYWEDHPPYQKVFKIFLKYPISS